MSLNLERNSMSTKTKATKVNKISLWLWGVALLAIIIFIGILGWQGFYGYVIPQASKAASLPLSGIVGFSLIAGILSFFAPCPFAVFPAYAAFFLASKEGKGSPRKQALRFAGTASAGVISFLCCLRGNSCIFGHPARFLYQLPKTWSNSTHIFIWLYITNWKATADWFS